MFLVIPCRKTNDIDVLQIDILQIWICVFGCIRKYVFLPGLEYKRFSGFKSLWVMFMSCKYLTATQISYITCAASIEKHDKFTVVFKNGKNFEMLSNAKLFTSLGKSAVLPVLYPLKQLSAFHAETQRSWMWIWMKNHARDKYNVAVASLSVTFSYVPFHDYQQTFVPAVGIFIHILDLDYVPTVWRPPMKLDLSPRFCAIMQNLQITRCLDQRSLNKSFPSKCIKIIRIRKKKIQFYH